MAILDLDMPKTDGFDVIRRIGLMYPEIRMLILTSMDKAFYSGRVRSLGGLGFVNELRGQMLFWPPVLPSLSAITSLPTAKMATTH